MTLERFLTRAILATFIVVVLTEALWIALKRAQITYEIRKQLRSWRKYWDQA